MANTRDIRRRIKSVSNTAQITKAMQLVAASKMKRAQEQALAGRHYADLMNKVLVNLKQYTQDETHPLLEERASGRELVVLVTSDKGLCGALNTNLIRKTLGATDEKTTFVTIGSRGRRVVARLKRDLLADFSIKDPIHFSEVKTISKFVREKYLEGDFSKVSIAFTNFVNTLTQEPYIETLLPVSPVVLGSERGFEGVGVKTESEAGEVPEGGYTYEPNARSVFDSIIPQYIDYEIYQMVLEARASEHSARMVAMKSATDNANELIKDLKLEYNKLRQAAITSELLEITTAQKVLE